MSRTPGLVVACAVVLGLTACSAVGSDDETPVDGAPPGGTTAGAVVIGLITSESGTFTEFGLPWRDSAAVAVEELNAEGGIEIDGERYPVRLEVRDDRSDPQAGVAAATELVEDVGIDMLVAPLISSIAPPVVDYATSKGVLTMTGAAELDARLSADSADGDLALLFKTQLRTESRGRMTLQALDELMPDITAVATLVPAHAGGQSIEASISAAAESGNIDLAAAEQFAPGTTDFATPLTRLERKNPDAVILCCGTAELSAIVGQAVELGSVPAVAGATYSMSIPLKEAQGRPIPIPSVHIGLPAFHEQLPGGEVYTSGESMKAYADSYAEVLGQKPPGAASNGLFIYDFVRMWAQAVGKTGTLTGTDVAASLQGLAYEGAIGSIEFGEDHVARHPIQACRVEDGEVAQCVDVPWTE